ncbi:MAG TPA: response regulator transcription factor, partial [Candidatus Limnocylindrales bacterium]
MEPARPSPTRVVLVDDHRLVIEALARLLAAEPDISVVATAGSLRELEPDLPDFDVAIVDYLLPDGTGADATRLMKQRWPMARVVVLSAVTDDYAASRATSAGADAYLGKGVSMAELLSALRHAASPGRSAAPAPAP